MKSLLLTLFCALSVLNINAQLSGTWLGDWQNAGLQQCQPSSLVITPINSTASSIQINFSPSNIQLCSSNPTFNVTGNYTDTITSAGGVWTDSKQYTLTLNGNVLSYQYGGAGQVNLLYTATGAIFSQQDSLGGIGGLWITPTPLPNTNTSGCCIPDTVYLTLADGQNRLNSLFSYTSTNCSANTSFSTRFAILEPTSSSLVWTATSTEEQGPYSIDFAPNATLATATLVWNSASCEIFYSRSPVTNLNDTWENDWQTSPNSEFVNVTSYQITSVTSLNTTYMISSNTNNGTVTNSYVVETPQGSYYDAFFNEGNGVTFDYNQPTQTLMDSSDELLLSLNGSVLTNAPFLGSWSTAVALSNTSLPEGCCVPTQINISSIGSGESPLSVDYQLPSDYNNYIGCRDLATAVDSSNVISSTLLLSGPPSVSQLTWYDNSFNNIIFTVSNKQLVVQNMTLGCGFTMSIPVTPTPGPTPTPTPEPLAGSMVSSGVVLLVIGLFMLAF